MDHALDLLELETAENLLTEDSRDIGLESYRFRWANLQGIEFDPTDTTTVYAEELNDILDRLDALGG